MLHLILQLLVFWISLSRSGHGPPVHIECGLSKDDVINVTYFGEAFSVYSTAKENDCILTQDPDNPVVRRFKGANETNCGLRWDGRLKCYTMNIRVQKGAILNEGDEVFAVTCAYGKTARPNSEFTIQDPNFLSEPVFLSNENLTNIQMVVKDEQDRIINNVDYGGNIKLSINATGITTDTIDVWSCAICDDLDNPPSINTQFLKQRCGTGYLMNITDGFTGTSPTELESDIFPMDSIFYGERFIMCQLTVCSINCTQGCQYPFQPQTGAVHMFPVKASLNVSPPPVNTIDVTKTPKSDVITKSADVTVKIPTTNQTIMQTSSSENNIDKLLPFIISLAVVLFIFFFAIVILVYYFTKRKRETAESHSTFPLFSPSWYNEGGPFVKLFTPYLNRAGYIENSSSTYSTSISTTESSETRPTRSPYVGRNRKFTSKGNDSLRFRHSFKPTVRFSSTRLEASDIFTIYRGSGDVCKQPISSYPNMFKK